MNRLFAILCAVMLTISLSAQTEARSFYISLGNAYSPVNQSNYLFNSNGMSFGNEWVTGITIDGDDDDDSGNAYWGDNNEEDKTFNFNLGGQFGYFIVDGLLTGIGIEHGSFSSMSYQEYDMDGDGYDDGRTSKSKLNSLAFSPFVKYYIPLGRNALFISSSYTFGTLNQSYETEWDYTLWTNDNDYNESEPYKTSRLEFGTGMAVFLTKSISFDPSVHYAFNTYTQEEEVYIGDTGPPDYTSIYDDQERKTSTNAFYFKIAASIYF